MNLQEFDNLPQDHKVAVICRQATFLGTCKEAEHVLALYHMNSFFIEVRYSSALNEIVQVQGFTSKMLLEPYLDTIELPRL
ncbi:hypothetical protein [Pontibacter pamirensis]|uniref:hypothetical protein n=1 Tax=Pontibacter pamirensis TaxID=2562824 RepID=UPI001389F7CE|nr:hypothetical protein [Pontibacter pamirensis]